MKEAEAIKHLLQNQQPFLHHQPSAPPLDIIDLPDPPSSHIDLPAPPSMRMNDSNEGQDDDVFERAQGQIANKNDNLCPHSMNSGIYVQSHLLVSF